MREMTTESEPGGHAFSISFMRYHVRLARMCHTLLRCNLPFILVRCHITWNSFWAHAHQRVRASEVSVTSSKPEACRVPDRVGQFKKCF